MSEENYKEDVAIDPDALDVACLNQATLMFNYSQKVAEARRLMDKAKFKIDIVRAECIAEIRKDPQAFGMDKFTEKGAETLVETLEDVQNINDDYLSLRYDYDVLSAAVKALEQRKSMLEKLVTLHGASYFAGPSVPRELSKEWVKETTRSSARETVKKAMTRRKR